MAQLEYSLARYVNRTPHRGRQSHIGKTVARPYPNVISNLAATRDQEDARWKALARKAVAYRRGVFQTCYRNTRERQSPVSARPRRVRVSGCGQKCGANHCRCEPPLSRRDINAAHMISTPGIVQDPDPRYWRTHMYGLP